MIAWLRCLFRRWHNPVRHPLGGFKCADCGEVGADLDDMGFVAGGYVPPVRRVYGRTDGSGFSRTSAWESTRRGW